MKHTDRIDDIMTDLHESRLQGSNYQKRDVLLSRLQTAWAPLITHIQSLAADRLPDDRRLRMELIVKEDLGITLNVIMEEAREYSGVKDSERYWLPSDQISFYRAANNSATLALVSGRLKLSDLFFARAGNPYALSCIDIGMTDEKLKNSRLHPDHMDDAKGLLEYWLAKQISLNFDPERLNPTATLEITMVRKDPAP